MQKPPEVGEELYYTAIGYLAEVTRYRVRVLQVSKEVDHRGQHRIFVEFLAGEKESRWVRVGALHRSIRGVVPAGTKKKAKRETRRCNLCGREFKARNRFMRFCDVCKGRSEVYRFAGG